MHFNIAERNELKPVFDFPKYNLWEEGEGGFIHSYFSTLKKILFKPSEFFMKTSSLKGWFMPLLFGVISESIGLIFALIYAEENVFSSGGFLRIGGDLSPPQIFLMATIAFFIYFPVITLFLHTGVFILGGRGGIQKTFRILTYSSASALLYAIPYAGSILAFIYRILIILKGYRVLHEFSLPRAFSALILPPLLVLFIFVIILLIPLALLGVGFLKNFIDFMQIFG